MLRTRCLFLLLSVCVVGSAAGCGASAIRDHARAALATAHVHRAAVTVVEAARTEALDRVEAAHPVDPEHDAAVLVEAARWRPALEALDAAAVAIRAWVDALDLARLAEVGDVGLVELLPLGARVLALLARVASLARSLGADVPEVPVWLEALLVGAGGES